MASIAYTQFMPEVMPHVPGCPEIVAINAVRNAAIDFCVQTLVWSETQDAVTVTGADIPYTLEAPTGAKAALILSVAVNGRLIDRVTEDSLEYMSNWRTQTGEPVAYYQPNPDEVVLYPLPEGAGDSVVFRIAYAPTRSSTSLAGFLYEDYLEAIVCGALFRLFAAPAAAWFNAELAAQYRAMFDDAVQDAQLDASKSFTRSAFRTRIHTF